LLDECNNDKSKACQPKRTSISKPDKGITRTLQEQSIKEVSYPEAGMHSIIYYIRVQYHSQNTAEKEIKQKRRLKIKTQK
jgi:hypothetical protein